MNETGSQGNIRAETVPGTWKHLANMIERHRDEWPEELLHKAIVAKLTLATIEMNPAHVIEAIKADAPTTWAGIVKDLMDFAEAYGAWKARS